MSAPDKAQGARAVSQDRRDIESLAHVVSEHLPSGYTAAEFHTSASSQDGKDDPSSSSSAVPTPSATAAEESSLKLQGGDIHRELFKIDAAARVQMHRRANTFHNTREFRQDDENRTLTVGDQLAPGGFRRAFLHQKHGHDFLAARMPVTRNFVEFLDLYGSFAGEDLVDSDDEAVSEGEGEDEEQRGETRPLLGPRMSSRAVRTLRSANAGTTKTFFTLVKAFIGTGVMFLPKAFNNGGLLFSSLAMLGVSAVSMWAFHLLLQCKKQYGGGYGELGHIISGEKMRSLILWSITLSQLGFVSAGIVFVAENMLTFLNAVTKGNSPLSSVGIILIQLLLLVPLAWIRNISKLGPAALLADACILIGISYIYWYDVGTLATQGIHESVVLFNPEKYTLMIGSAIFTFEGIGLILPIQSSMAKPQHFEWLLAGVMLLITIIFTSVGAMCYATFGELTQIEIINNFPQDSKLVNAVQFLYSVAVLVGTPVQLFPALRILEGKVFGKRSGKKSLRTKWVKNAFRVAMVAVCGAVSIAGTGNLDKFVALIGSVACIPLVYVYPAYLHYTGVATTPGERAGDIAMMILGTVGMIYTTSITVANSFL
ncbi:transmembrane amino acid transporter protein-domain-containing protein [Podospora appendiculata]|uniref:Transmembrane amino acid transporter protein-domain-containing protein n=1 Tax=Podospora appendiculata TaxID=314037 RepID=A0AAE1C8N0_9PEZI|nr:transmembrane amino acid transporter protein-domain-containing protein [Podospora appendiculata]